MYPSMAYQDFRTTHRVPETGFRASGTFRYAHAPKRGDGTFGLHARATIGRKSWTTSRSVDLIN